MFLIFSIMFAVVALFFPVSDVQQGVAFGFSLYTGFLALAFNIGEQQTERMARQRKQKV